MKYNLIIFLSAFCLFFFTRCGGIIYGIAIGMDNLDTSRKYKQLEKNNEQFDENGWYRFNHHFNAESLHNHFKKKDSLYLIPFYFPEEFNYLKNHLITKSELDTFEVIYPLNSTEQRKFLDFSPTRNDFTVNSAETIKELNGAFHFYLDLGSDEIASCYITDKEIIIPYILIKSETIIAKPKPYIPPIPFDSYLQLLPTIKEVKVVDHAIDIGKPLSFVDTTKQFSNFLKTHSFAVIYTSSISTIDTNYELNHKMQYNFDLNGSNHNFYRHDFVKFNSISDIIQNESYYLHPEKEQYVKPDTKLRYKKKLDLIFKQLAKEHSEFMRD